MTTYQCRHCGAEAIKGSAHICRNLRGHVDTPQAQELPASITGDEWGQIQGRVDQDCPMSIVAALGNQAISWSIAADRIVAYTESAYIQGRIFGQAESTALRAALHGLLMHIALTGGEIGPNDKPCVQARAALGEVPPP